jgi:carbonic anhydrase
MAFPARIQIRILVLSLGLSLSAMAEEHKAAAEHGEPAKPAAPIASKPQILPAKPEITPGAIERAQARAVAETPPPEPVRAKPYVAPPPRRIALATPPARATDTAKMAMEIVAPVVPAPPHILHWSYEGDTGPQSWARLAPEYAKCGSGERQSPIDIRDGMKLDLEPITFEYRPSSFRVLDNGHTIQTNVNGWNAIRVMGRRYRLEQFHFHRPSEEMIDGKQYEMVVHMVHKDGEGRLAVLAVLVEIGASQPVVQTVLNNLPLEKGEEIAGTSNLDLVRMLPEDRRYFTYMGSLTTPPCTENVLWIVMKKPVQATAEQLDLFSRMYPMNARPIQSAAGRTIKESN